MNKEQLLEYLRSLPENKGKDDKSIIKDYQTSLNNEGYRDMNEKELKIDGIIGPKTLSAYNRKVKGKEVPVTDKENIDEEKPQKVTNENDNKQSEDFKSSLDPEIEEKSFVEAERIKPEDKPIDENPEIVFDRSKSETKPTEFQEQFEDKILLGNKDENKNEPVLEPNPEDNRNKKEDVKPEDAKTEDTPANTEAKPETETKSDNNQTTPVEEKKTEPLIISEKDIIDDNQSNSNSKSFTQSFLPEDYRNSKPGFYPGIGLFARKSNSNNTSDDSDMNYQEGSDNAGNRNSGRNRNNNKPFIEYDRDDNEVNVNLRKLPKFKVNRADGSTVRFMGNMRDRMKENKERRSYLSDEAQRYADDQINQTGMKSIPNDMNKKETRRFSRQVQKNIRNQQQDDLNAIQDENQRARIVNRMEGKADRLVNNYNDKRNNYVIGQNNKTARVDMRQDYKTQREDMIEDSRNQRRANAIENKQNNFNSRYNKKMQRLQNQKADWETRGMENKNNGKGVQLNTLPAINTLNNQSDKNTEMLDGVKYEVMPEYKKGGNIPKYQSAGYVNPLDNKNIDYSLNNSNVTNYQNSMYGEPLAMDTTPLTKDKSIVVNDTKGNISYNQPSYSAGLQFNSNNNTNPNVNTNNRIRKNQYVSDYDETRLEHYGDRLQHNANLLPVLYNTSKAIFDKPELQKPIQNEQAQAALATMRNNVINVNTDNINAGRIAAANTIRNNARSSGSTMNNLLALNTNTSRELNNEQYRVDSANSAQKNTYANMLNQVGNQRQLEKQRIDEANRSHRLAMDKFRRDALESGEKAMINKGQMLNQQKQDRIKLDTYVNNISADYKVDNNPDGTYSINYKGKQSKLPRGASAEDFAAARAAIDKEIELQSTDKEGNRKQATAYDAVDRDALERGKKANTKTEEKKQQGGNIRKFIF